MPSDTTSLLAGNRSDDETENNNANSRTEPQRQSLIASFLQRASYGAVSPPDSSSGSSGGSEDEEEQERDTTTTTTTTVSSENNNDNRRTMSLLDQQEGTDPQPPPPAGNSGQDQHANNSDANENGARDGAIGRLTRRLRCLFSTITWPIVPLGTIVALALLWVLYAASSLDLQRTCSHPLHWYALASLILVAYIPHHSNVRSHLFHYSRDRDGPIRPARVRMYDQFFHTICLLYVYTGVTLIQTCKEDIITNESVSEVMNKSGGADSENSIQMPRLDGPLNSCAATCPNLYQALSVYVATLEMFTFALILPLLFLPCIYLWFLRRATAEAEAFAQLQDRLQEEEALLNNGGITAAEILDSLESVKLVSRRQESNNNSRTNSGQQHNNTSGSSMDADGLVWLLPSSATNASIGRSSNVKECCICMSDFPVQDEADLEDGLNDEKAPLTTSSSKGIVRTRCGHVFHKECLAGWVEGRWQMTGSGPSNEEDSSRRRARQTCCPLCRTTLLESTANRSSQ